MTDAVRKYEHVPNRRKMIHDPMMTVMIGHDRSDAPDSLTATLCDWTFLGRYTGFCKSEWCNDHHTTYSRIEDPLWSGLDVVSFIPEDFSFFNCDGVRFANVSTLSLDQVGYSTILHRRQKNSNNYQTITYGKCT
jgi:hypothetical protein